MNYYSTKLLNIVVFLHKIEFVNSLEGRSLLGIQITIHMLDIFSFTNKKFGFHHQGFH